MKNPLQSNNTESLNELVNEVNPFLLKTCDGTFIKFHHPADAYHHVMLTFVRECPKGYVELPYILWVLYPDMKWSQIKKAANIMIAHGCSNIMQIDYGSKESFVQFEHFFTSLHTLAGTSFLHDAFHAACKTLVYSAEYFKQAKQTSNEEKL